MMNISPSLAGPAKSPANNPLPVPNTHKGSNTRFSGNSSPINHSAILKAQNIPGLPNAVTIDHAVKHGQPIPLRGGGQILYGTIGKNAQGKLEVKSGSEKAKKLVNPGLSSLSNLSSPEELFFIVENGQKDDKTSNAIQTIVSDLIPAHLQGPTKKGKGHQAESGQVIYSDLVEKLVSGQKDNLNPELRKQLDATLQGKNAQIRTAPGASSLKTLEGSSLGDFYKVIVPNNAALQTAIHEKNQTFRSQLLGLALARKIYSEGQEVEWKSVALSLGLGAVGEPTIHALFKDGGTTATIARSGLMSGIDIMGNVLSVMGMVKEKHKSLSMDTVFGPKEQRSYLNPAGKAGPDIKDGAKHGFLYGLGIGVPFNIPAGGVLSLPNAGVLPRSIIGGLSDIGSAVAIPPAVKKDLAAFEADIRQLIKEEKFSNVPTDKKERDQWVRKLALKEMNTRLGYASSIKAAHPLPLIGTGAAILGAEKLGIPREYVQTAFMCLAPVMNNFLRLVFSGTEKYHAIPQRLKTLESVAMGSDAKDATPEKTQKKLDKALSGSGVFGSWYTEALTNTALIAGVGVVLLTAEVLYYLQTKKKSDAAEASPENQQKQPPQPLNLKPTHYPPEFGDQPQFSLNQLPSPFANPQPTWLSQPVNRGAYAPLPTAGYNTFHYNPQPAWPQSYPQPIRLTQPLFPYQVAALVSPQQ